MVACGAVVMLVVNLGDISKGEEWSSTMLQGIM